MLTITRFAKADFEINCYEEPPLDPSLVKKEMSQKDIDDIVLKRTEQARTGQKDALKQFEELKGQLQLTEAQKSEYETQLDELRKKTLTTEELKKRELLEAEKVHGQRLSVAEKEAKTWKDRHDSLLIDSDIAQACIKAKVLPGMVEIVGAYLKPKTRLVENTQGNTTRFTPTVDFNDVGADGQPCVTTLNTLQVVERMKKLPAYASMFEGNAVGGAGAGSGAGTNGKPLDVTEMTQAQFMEARVKNPTLVYGRK